MGAVVAVLQSDSNLMRCQVHRLGRHVALGSPERPPDAYGFGYYTASDVLLGKRPSGAAHPLTLEELVGDVDTEALLVHARHATVGNHKDENTHPFRSRRWLFAHIGTIEGFDQVRAAIEADLPDHLRRGISGETDSEHAFALFLKTLRDAGELDNLDVDPATAGRALALTVKRIDELCRAAGVQKPSTLGFVATNGRIMAATRRGTPLFYALLEGIVPCDRDGITASSKETDPRFGAHRRVKAVCFASNLLAPNGFIEVPDCSVVTVSRTLQVSIATLAAG
ncbi:MAG TPA: class II glutamine amidotransferase [Anaeromyxobacteraceae bacterium]|nr:class II glutamine amidotransferase [Anaeromyxobacteraceae bacterium]